MSKKKPKPSSASRRVRRLTAEKAIRKQRIKGGRWDIHYAWKTRETAERDAKKVSDSVVVFCPDARKHLVMTYHPTVAKETP